MTHDDFTAEDLCGGRWPKERRPSMDEHIRHVVDKAPPLTEGQRARLAALLCGVGEAPAPTDDLAELVPEFTGQPARKVRKALPKRTPGQYAKDPVWD